MANSAWLGEIVERLRHQGLEHQDGRIWRTPALRTVRALKRLGQRLLEHGPGNDAVQLLQRIADRTHPLGALVQIPKAWLSNQRLLPANLVNPSEAENTKKKR